MAMGLAEHGARPLAVLQRARGGPSVPFISVKRPPFAAERVKGGYEHQQGRSRSQAREKRRGRCDGLRDLAISGIFSINHGSERCEIQAASGRGDADDWQQGSALQRDGSEVLCLEGRLEGQGRLSGCAQLVWSQNCSFPCSNLPIGWARPAGKPRPALCHPQPKAKARFA